MFLKILGDKKEVSIEQYKNLSPSGSRSGIQLKSTKFSQMAFHLLDLFYLAVVHLHINLQSS